MGLFDSGGLLSDFLGGGTSPDLTNSPLAAGGMGGGLLNTNNAPATPISSAGATIDASPSQRIYDTFYNHAINQGAPPEIAQKFAHVGLGTASREGLNAGGKQGVWGPTGDGGASWGPFQLYTKGGLGNMLKGDMSPENQLAVAARVMYGNRGNEGVFNTTPWNGVGDYISGRGQVGDPSLNSSLRGQQAMATLGAKIAGNLTPNMSTAPANPTTAYSLPSDVAGTPGTSLTSMNAPQVALAMPAGTNAAPAPTMVATDENGMPMGTNLAGAPAGNVATGTGTTWRQKLEGLNKLLADADKAYKQDQPKQQQGQANQSAYNALINQHINEVQQRAKQRLYSGGF